MNKFEIKKEEDGWFAVFNVATGERVHIGSPNRELETPAGKAEWLRCNAHRNNFTGD